MHNIKLSITSGIDIWYQVITQDFGWNARTFSLIQTSLDQFHCLDLEN
jgi:hypothetical protein